jgi:hypothetical protein
MDAFILYNSINETASLKNLRMNLMPSYASAPQHSPTVKETFYKKVAVRILVQTYDGSEFLFQRGSMQSPWPYSNRLED